DRPIGCAVCPPDRRLLVASFWCRLESPTSCRGNSAARRPESPHSKRRTDMFRFAFQLLMLVPLMTLHSPSVSAPSKAPARSAAKPASTQAIVNLNSATAADLETLPGIGAKTAARIVEYRQKNGPFKKVEELMNVRGFGEKNFLKLKPQLTVGNAKAEPPQQPQR